MQHRSDFSTTSLSSACLNDRHFSDPIPISGHRSIGIIRPTTCIAVPLRRQIRNIRAVTQHQHSSRLKYKTTAPLINPLLRPRRLHRTVYIACRFLTALHRLSSSLSAWFRMAWRYVAMPVPERELDSDFRPPRSFNAQADANRPESSH
jgi:hypothetical protein